MLESPSTPPSGFLVRLVPPNDYANVAWVFRLWCETQSFSVFILVFFFNIFSQSGRDRVGPSASRHQPLLQPRIPTAWERWGNRRDCRDCEVEKERVCRKFCRLQSLSRARIIFIISIASGPFKSMPCCTAQGRPNGGDDLVRLGGSDQLGRGDSKKKKNIEDSRIPVQEPVGQAFQLASFSSCG
jgi:hypothetical protein